MPLTEAFSGAFILLFAAAAYYSARNEIPVVFYGLSFAIFTAAVFTAMTSMYIGFLVGHFFRYKHP